MKYFLPIFLFLLQGSLFSQDKMTISLTEVIQIAQGEAPISLIARTRFTNNYWRYQSFLADFKPQLSFIATIPDLDRTIDAITLPDGSDVFVNRSLMSSSVGVRMSQIVPQTGGFFYAATNLRRIDLFKNDLNPASKSYLSAPLSIGFNQPFFQFNGFKWDKKIELLQFEESRQRFTEEKEQIAYDAVNLFYTLYISQLNLEEARRQKTYADSLYETSQGRFEVGRIAETELLQIELRSKNAETEVAAELLNFQTANEALRNFLGIQSDVEFSLLPPESLPEYNIDVEKALTFAQKNRSQTTEFRRRRIQAEMGLDEANKSTGFSLDLSGYFGLSNSAETLADAYKSPVDQERITLRLEVPIADWGKSRARKEIAQSNLELTLRTLEQDQINFEREIILKVQQIILIRNQMSLAERAFEVAEKRLEIAKNRYQIGKIGVTDLNIALNEYDGARRAYFQSLWTLWTAHYEIRNLTLYDFIENKELISDNPLGESSN